MEGFLYGEGDPLTHSMVPKAEFLLLSFLSLCSLETNQSILVKGPRESLGRNPSSFRHSATPRSNTDRPRCSDLARSCSWAYLDDLFIERPQPRRAGPWTRELQGRLGSGDRKGEALLLEGKGTESPVVP